MGGMEIVNIDTKDLVDKSETFIKIATEYSNTLKELYELFSKLKENGVIVGGNNVNSFIVSLKNDLVNYNKLSTDLKKRFEAVTNYANELESFLVKVENDKILL